MGSIPETKELLRKLMKGDWKEVVEIYRKNPMVHKAKITRSGNTALHLAVSTGRGYIVRKLVEIIGSEEADDKEDKAEERVGIAIQDPNEVLDRKKRKAKEVLEIKNDRGNTPLHLAASIGNVRMCDLIVKVDRSLVGARNDDNETPFFLAAHCGKKEAFFCLNKYIPDTKERYEYCRRKDGDTILHCAIDRDYFDLAFQIIHLYPDLVYSVNEQGFSPLHRLASNSYAFRSGIDLGICSKIIYHCLFVDELNPSSNQQSTVQNLMIDLKKFYRMLRNDFFRIIWSIIRHGFQDTIGPQGHRLFPANYDTCFDIVKLPFKAMKVIFLVGLFIFLVALYAPIIFPYGWITNIRDQKKKHRWSVQIMNELLKRTSRYEYENTGTNPRPATSPTEDEIQPLETNQEDKNEEKNVKDKDEEGQKDKSRTTKGETAILIAAKNGVTEMVEKILELFPEAIHDMNTDKKNIVLLAVENRQPHVYELLLKRPIVEDEIFQKVDRDGNTAIHLALKLGDKYWQIPGPALQMQWEMKWVEVRSQTPDYY